MCGWGVRGPRELGNMNSELRKKTEKRVAPNEPTLRAKGRPGMGRGRKDEVQRTKDERGWSADQEKEQRFDRLTSVRARRVEDTAGELRDTHYEAPAANHQPPFNSHQKDQWPNKAIFAQGTVRQGERVDLKPRKRDSWHACRRWPAKSVPAGRQSQQRCPILAKLCQNGSGQQGVASCNCL